MPSSEVATSRPVPASVTTDAPRAGRTLLIASLGFFLITLDILIVNVALPSIAQELGGGTTAQQWVIDGYTLMFAALLLFAGNLADRIGARRAMGWGIALFLLASTACALAPTTGALIASRFVQGAAASTILPASMSLIREAFPDGRRRAKALGIWAVGGAVAGAVGPLLGGLLTTVDWRLVFAVNLPVCVGMLVLLRYVTASPLRPAPFDWAGQLLAIVALAALMYGLIHGGSIGFSSPSVIITLIVAAGGIVGFLVVEARGRHPMMPLLLFRATGMRIALSVGFAFMAGWFGTVFSVSLFLQQHLGLSPLHAGLVFLPAAVFAMAGNVLSGAITNRFGPRVPVVAGQLAMVVGLVALLTTAPLGSALLTAILLILIGPGGSVAMPAITGVVLDSVPAERAGTASAVFNTFRQVGGAVAIAVFGALLGNSATFVTGMQTSFAIAASLLLVTALVSLRIHSQRRTAG
ncbi:MAG: putative drug resistance transporter [Marmoricola sp.]|nr:putative drug resistance transporter [Marmoricola sp.]